MRVAGRSWVELFRRHERAFTAGYLAVVALFALVFLVDPLRVRVLDRVQAGLFWWDERWIRRLRAGERMVAEGRMEEAADYLSRLDRIHPATGVRHGRDKERERLLRALARSYEALDRRALTIATLNRLIAFDSLNYLNHFLMAKAAERLLSGWAVAPEARDAYERVLRLFPSHLPSLRGCVEYYMDRGEFGPVTQAYQTYLDAHLVQEVELRIGGTKVLVPVLVDGRVREYEVPVALPPGHHPSLELATDGFSAALVEAALYPAARVGRLGTIPPAEVDLTRAELVAMEPAGPGAFRARDSTAAIRLSLPSTPDGVAAVRLRLGLFKPIDRSLWGLVARSFRNLLDSAGLEAASRRTVAVERPEDADLVLARLRWATEGLALRPGERAF
jgi:tetratricopeptide (TPR) repeat protein